jgi:hypothetical protein
MSINDLEEHLKNIKTSEKNLSELIDRVLAEANMLTGKINDVQTDFDLKKIKDKEERKKAEDEAERIEAERKKAESEAEFNLIRQKAFEEKKQKDIAALEAQKKVAADLKAKAAEAKLKVTDCSNIKYQNSPLLKKENAGGGKCFFLCLQDIFRINGIEKPVDTIREEVSNSLKQYIIQNLKTPEGKEIVTVMFYKLFSSPVQDQKNKELTVKCMNKSLNTNKINLNAAKKIYEKIIFYVNSIDPEKVASCYIAPITQTYDKNGYECWMDENYLYDVGNYVKSVIKNSSGIIILNCVQSPTILIFPNHNEIKRRDVKGLIETVKTYTKNSINNRFLIIRVNGNHYVLGLTRKDNKYNYYFNLHQENWQGLISTDFIDAKDFIDEEDLANHIAQSIAREEEAARQAQKVAN